jgi:hypothetical protein
MTSFIDAYNKVDRLIEERYGIRSTIGDVLDPNTGDFDGESIKVDHTLNAEQALFVLLHLFGHTVQWCTSEEFRDLGQQTVNRATPEQLAKIEVYERDATRYAIQLMHEAGVHDLDQWASDWWLADWECLKAFYTTGAALDQNEVANHVRANSTPPLEPLAIPPFEPRRYVSRWAFAFETVTDQKP